VPSFSAREYLRNFVGRHSPEAAAVGRGDARVPIVVHHTTESHWDPGPATKLATFSEVMKEVFSEENEWHKQLLNRSVFGQFLDEEYRPGWRAAVRWLEDRAATEATVEAAKAEWPWPAPDDYDYEGIYS
jgi:hypothetical protein